MKRPLHLLYLTFLLPLLSSCQIGGLEQGGPKLVMPSAARTASCQDYVFESKSGDVTNWGPAHNNVILVRFQPDATPTQRERLLSTFPFYERMEGEVTLDSGEITKVRLKQEATCFEAEKTIKMLQKEELVQFATPVFYPSESLSESYEWVGLTNEFIVVLGENGTLAQLEALAAETGTTIVFSLSDEIHVLSADKNATGNALELSNQFNKTAFIASAEPNYIYYLSPFGVENTGLRAVETKGKVLKK